MSALLTVEYLEARAARGSRADFQRVHEKAKDRVPTAGDERE